MRPGHPGVKSVDAEKLTVDPNAEPDAFRKDKFTKKSDAAVKDAVEDALFNDARVNSYNVTTQVNNGKVTLTGTVDNIRAKRTAEEVAKNVVGVWSVVNNIMTKPQSVEAQTLEANIDWALSVDPVVEQYEINSTVNNGKVTLSGTVDTYYEKVHAQDVVADLAGVTEVENNLQVKNTYSYLFWMDADPAERVTKEQDEEIKEKSISRSGGHLS